MTERPSILWLLLRRMSLRHWRDAPWQSGLLVVILALGVAVYFSIRLANRAVLASFSNFTDILTEQSDWVIRSPAGTLPASILPELRQGLGDRPVHLVPVVETTATEPPASADETIGQRRTYQLLGLDLIALQNLRVNRTANRSSRSPEASVSWFNQTPSTQTERTNRFWEFFDSPRSVFISTALADEKRLKPGDSLSLVINESIVPFEIAGIIPSLPDRPAPPRSMLVMDQSMLQSLNGRPDRIDRVECVLEPGGDLDLRRSELKIRLDGMSGGRWQIESPKQRRDSGAMMTRAFRLNLTILSLIALVVGLYLIFQALDGAVIRRRDEIGILRALGVEERTIQQAWLLEAAALGLLGGLLGSVPGWLGAQAAVQLVGRTVNALYRATSADAAALEPTELLLAVILAMVAGILAGWAPARSAARTPPAQLLVRGGGPNPGPRALRSRPLALALMAFGMATALLPPLRFDGGIRFPVGGYASALCWIFAGGIFSGELLSVLGRMLRPIGPWSPVWRLAVSQIRPPTGRHRLAAASLSCAVAMTAGMAILVGSFSQTMNGWIERAFQADLYISSAGAQSASTDNRISTAVWRELVARADVAAANVMQAHEIQLPGGPTMVVGADIGFTRDHANLAWLKAPPPEAFDRSKNADMAFVSESFTERYQLNAGDRVTIPTPAGSRTLKIVGVFGDYGNERGSVVLEGSRVAGWFGTDLASSVILKLKPDTDADLVRTEILSAHPGLSVFTNSHLRREILRIFGQTFSITYVLEFIGVVVAVVGLAMTLASLLLQRRAELTTLRALGMTHFEIAHASAIEGALTALAGLVSGLAVSGALGWILIHVINKQTFGWTLQADVPVALLAGLGGLVVLSGTVVALAVGRWGAGLPADREE